VNQEKPTEVRTGYCIYIDTFFQGATPNVSDGENQYVIFDSELEAQKEIVDYAITRLQQFLDGERDFDDAITVEEYVVPVTVHPDGTILDGDGNTFHRRVE
jgi:hypothetical protein